MEQANFSNYIYGKNAVLETLDRNSSRINKIFVSKNIGLDNRLKKIIELAKQKSIIIQFTNLNNDKFPKDIPHQGVIAYVSPVEYMKFEDFLDKMDEKEGYKKIVILENIQDPHNLGAIIRTCACAGYDGIMLANHRACPINTTVEKTSAGAVNHIPIIKVNSLSSAIDTLKNKDWWIIATSARCEDNYYDIDYTDMNFALIMGSEGPGVTKTLMNKADFKVKLPCNFESLNVSNATAVILYESVRQISIKQTMQKK
ncbi:MAG: 23S rRNA (guanosine(2251)-2'-O)-methyltransferase RlmB [Cyanobacteria bacterium SIG30]|nr:23S rRNA (guanosine(2251)-2'-O)-methyltransferase RlmB [Cyanobacteria bacterium SIG30]